jgi:hypothetical protein
MGDRRGAYRVLVGRPEERKPLGRPGNRWEDNTNMVLREVGRGGMDLIDLAEDWDWLRALVNAVISLRVP